MATKQPVLWSTSISNNGDLAEVVIQASIMYNDQSVLVGDNRDNKRFLYSINSNEGEVEWTWGYLLSQLTNPTYIDPLSIRENRYHVFNKEMAFIDGGNTYLLDLPTGKTVARNQVTLSRYPQSSGLENLLFTSGSVRNSGQPEGLYVTDLKAMGDPSLVTMPIYDYVDEQSLFKGMIGETLPFQKNGDILVAVLFNDPAKTGRRYATAMGLYNYSQHK